MSRKELTRRYVVFASALLFSAFGVSLITRALLGTSPISSVPYVLSLNAPLTMGAFTFIMNMVMIVCQMLMLGKQGIKEKKVDLIVQIPVSITFSTFIDVTMAMLSGFHPEMYLAKLCSLILGCLVLAFGISLEVLADVTMLSGEYTVQVAARRFKKEFGILKIFFDWTLVVIALAISLSCSGTVEGIREGTIIAAFITGPFVKFLGRFVKPIGKWFVVDRPVASEVVAMTAENAPIVITIAREYGSGGHDIGKKIADDLGIKFYDNQLITMAAEESGMSESTIRQHEQSVNPNILLRMVMHDYEAPIEKSLSPSDASFVATSRVVRKIATEGDCVIVGRCSDWILRDMPNCINVFIHADMPYKVERAIANYGLNAQTAAQEIDRINRSRAAHYQHYTGKVWTDANNYHIVCDSSHISVDQISSIIETLYKQRKRA
jgi:uncharacterized membrane protein YczE